MWPDATETQAMLEHAARDDASAVDRLLACHREPLRRMIAVRLDRSLGRREDASDVVQSVLLGGQPAAGRLPAQSGAAVSALAQADRPRSVERRSSASSRGGSSEHRSGTAHRRSTSSSTARRWIWPRNCAIRGRLRRPRPFAASWPSGSTPPFMELGEDDREILLLRHFEHLTNGETARALGLSEPAAGMRYLRALRRLRAVLGTPPSQAG